MNPTAEQTVDAVVDHVEEVIGQGDGRGGFLYTQDESIEILRTLAGRLIERAQIIESEIEGA